VINTEPMSMQDPIEWTADSAGIIALTEHEEIVRLDASKAAPPQVLGTQINASGSIVWNANLRPPEGDQFLIRNHDATALQVVNLDGSGTRTLVEAPGGKEHADSENFGNFAWSPDGSQIAFTMRPEIGSEELRIYVMNADGTNVRRLEHEPGPLVTVDFAWSPDGTKIAYNRWHQGELDLWEVMPIGVAKVADGTVVDAGPAPVSEGAVFGWSPDGSTIVSLPGPVYDGIPNALTAAPTAIDIATGESRELDVDVQSATSWQRVAP
jgi:Tol biopolymer transport system component